MLLRPRQKTFVERSVSALGEHGNTLAVASTGFGKTIALAGVAGQLLAGNDAKACVLAHRDELTAQNQLKFSKVNPNISTSEFDALTKSWRGQTTFAMVPTLARKANLDAMPVLDLLVIDEAHHVAADSYRRIIDQAKNKNPDVKIFGVTATPNRGDKKGLRPVFSNVADQVFIGELIASGHLVPPRTFVIDVGAQEALKSVRKTVASDPFIDFSTPETPRASNLKGRNASLGNQPINRAFLDLQVLGHLAHGHDVGLGHRPSYLSIEPVKLKDGKIIQNWQSGESK